MAAVSLVTLKKDLIALNTLWTVLLLLLTACHPKSCVFEPKICYTPPACLFETLPSAFPALTESELQTDWGRELLIAQALAKEADLYRAITTFKRAEILIQQDPLASRERVLQIEYGIVLAYYAGNKYWEALEYFECSRLIEVPADFPAFRELLIVLYDAYLKTCQKEKALRILNLINSLDSCEADDLLLSTALTEPDFCLLDDVKTRHPLSCEIDSLLTDFCYETKSVKKAQTLNALLPGAGYAYVGQTEAGVTSFLINALFTAAAWQLFDRGYVPAGIIVSSLEFGWYIGGINGAGLAAKEWNERLYATKSKCFLTEQKLFPILMFQTAF